MREFLVSLGFVVDNASEKKFTGTIEKTTKLAMGLGKGVLAVATAAQVMVSTFTSSMEKLYYASRRTGASVDNLQAVEFGAKNIGLQAGQATASLEAMSAAVRMNPGLRGMLDGIVGHSTAGMDQMEAMVELVQKLSNMPHFVGARYASMFGVDEKTFLMLKQGMPEMLAAIEKRKKLAADAGVNGDEMAKASKEYGNMWRDILEKVSIIGQKWTMELLPVASKFAQLINDALDRLTKFKMNESVAQFMRGWDRLFGDKPKVPDAPKEEEPKKGLGFKWAAPIQKGIDYFKGKPPTVTDADRSVAPGKVDLRNMTPEQKKKVEALAEKQFALRPPAKEWDGKPPVFAKTAPGEWDARNAQYAADKPGRDAGQIAILNQELLDEKNPRNRAALQREIGRVPGGATTTINQKTDINVSGVTDPTRAARETAREQQRVNADLFRNMQGATQ